MIIIITMIHSQKQKLDIFGIVRTRSYGAYRCSLQIVDRADCCMSFLDCQKVLATRGIIVKHKPTWKQNLSAIKIKYYSIFENRMVRFYLNFGTGEAEAVCFPQFLFKDSLLFGCCWSAADCCSHFSLHPTRGQLSNENSSQKTN